MMQLQLCGDSGQAVGLNKPTYLIGHSNLCNLRFTEYNLEPIHARLKVKGDSVALAGQDDAVVQVNGKPLKGEAVLHHGDEVKLADMQFKVVDPQKGSVEGGGACEAPGRTWALHALSSGLATKRYAIDDTVLIGRGKDCDIRIREAHMSRRHARLSLAENGLFIEDLQSSNGTYVNGRRIEKALLKNGDELSFDTVRFRVMCAKVDTDTDETLVHAPDARTPEPEKKPQRPKPSGPTAIDIQRAALEREEDSFRNTQQVKAQPRRAPGGDGWLTVMTVVVVIVGALWGAKSFFEPAFLG
jgi:pSer/pThr/pTyr-binding forkhead associated (FHA) protein